MCLFACCFHDQSLPSLIHTVSGLRLFGFEINNSLKPPTAWIRLLDTSPENDNTLKHFKSVFVDRMCRTSKLKIFAFKFSILIIVFYPLIKLVLYNSIGLCEAVDWTFTTCPAVLSYPFDRTCSIKQQAYP